MYRVSPFTYLVSAVLSTGLAGSEAVCSDIELLKVNPPDGQTCEEYLGGYVKGAQANLLNPSAKTGCEVCSITSSDQFLAQLQIYYSDHWRNVGLLFAYIIFNVIAALFLYWLARVPKKWSRKVKEE